MAEVTVVGAGPAGAAIAFLLARNDINVTLLERRRDFSREFRGEVLMPGGLDALEQMGLLDEVLALPGVTQTRFAGFLDRRKVADFPVAGDVPIRAISQPALLEMLVAQAERYPSFRFIRGAAVKELVRDVTSEGADGRVRAVRFRADGIEQEISTDLCIGADGRNSMVRKALQLPTKLHAETQDAAAPMDIVWCQVPRPAGWEGARAYAGSGHLLLAYEKWDGELQLGWVILKGQFGDLRAKGTRLWVQDMARQVPADLAQHLLAHQEHIKKPFLLDVVADCVQCWNADGALVIGDAAHTMSPVGAQGINVALRDALVAANQLVGVLGGDTAEGAEGAEGAKGAKGAKGVASDPLAIDARLRAIEVERMVEIRQIQSLQSIPPRVILRRGWLGETARRLLGWSLRHPAVRAGAARRLDVFLHGATKVSLIV